MTCGFAHEDGAYVLGALSPADRQEFERHLPGCADCTRAVGTLAGLPGLLGRVDPELAADPGAGGLGDEDPLPPTLLPSLLREARHRRRRRTWTLAASAAAAVVLAVASGAAVSAALHDPQGSTRVQQAGPTAPAATPSPAAARPMDPVGEVPVRAEVRLQPVTWGTRLDLACTYDAGLVSYDLPPEVDYVLFVRTRSGAVEQVGSWRSVDGRPMRLSAATSASPSQLASVEVRTVDGRVVLRLAT